MIYTLIGILVLLWIVGLLARVGGGFIHVLLGLALIIFLFNLFTGRRVGL